MTRRELIDLCLTLPLAYEEYPFHDATAVIRHNGNKKIFAFIIVKDDKLIINLKCDPMKADFLRSVYQSVVPGWHMHKAHWNTVYTDGDVPAEDLYDMIQHSYDLTKPKERKRNHGANAR